MDSEGLTLLRDLSDHLATEILGNFTEDDFEYLGHSIEKLQHAARYLEAAGDEVPFTVKQLIANFESKTAKVK